MSRVISVVNSPATLQAVCFMFVGVLLRDVSVPKMCTSGGRQCKAIPIPHFSTPQPNMDVPFHVLTSEIKVLKYCNQHMAVLFNVITIKVCKMHKIMR